MNIFHRNACASDDLLRLLSPDRLELGPHTVTLWGGREPLLGLGLGGGGLGGGGRCLGAGLLGLRVGSPRPSSQQRGTVVSRVMSVRCKTDFRSRGVRVWRVSQAHEHPSGDKHSF